SGLSSYRPGWTTAPLTKTRTVGGAGGSTVSPGTGIGAAADAWCITDQPAAPQRASSAAPTSSIRRGLILRCCLVFANMHESVMPGSADGKPKSAGRAAPPRGRVQIAFSTYALATPAAGT